ncbi:mitochondrial, 28S ribosomal protein S31 [Lucilia cuprina]|nr:mitochondrial, 28S ribosomal protein S31 [Lucilia cuprina]
MQESQSTDSSYRNDTQTTTTEKQKRHDRISQQTVSIQNLQFPVINTKSPGTFKVKCQRNDFKHPESSTTPAAKERGYDFTSSTNSYFTQMVLTVPKNIRAKCTSSSTSDVEAIKHLSSDTLKSSKPTREQSTATSQQMIDSQHEGSDKPTNFHGAQWRRPCKESFVAGAPRKYIGTCSANYEQLSKMSKTRQKFFLTQDPRKVQCLVNPEVLRSKEYSKKKEFTTLTKMVKHAQNVCVATASESSEDFICEVIDLENPMQLDFQGLDYQNTYQKDEQDFQNHRNYRRVCRYMERRRVKAETKGTVEAELHEEMINIPKRFNIRDRNEPVQPTPIETPLKLGKLYRSADKPRNQKLINLENERRRERYKDLYLRNKERQEQKRLAEEVRQKVENENLALTLADANLKKLVTSIDETIERCAGIEINVKKKLETERRSFPHTMQETKHFKRDLKYKNLIKRDKARITKEFFLERKDKVKKIPAAELEFSSETNEQCSVRDSNLTEQSTNDEDNLEVGKEGSKFKLRGFQYKMDNKLRGKLTQHEMQRGTRKEKTCITREQWLKELAPKKQQIKLDVEMGIQKLRTPDDPQLVLFPPPFGFKAPQAKGSTIRDYILKPLGRHYERVRRKNLKFAKPRLRYNVKKFNLISYRFGDTSKRFSQLKDPLADVAILKLKSTNEFMAAKALREKRGQEQMKQKRLQLLGIPCRPLKKSRLQTKCENSSSSSDSDWVPAQEPLVDELEKEDLRPLAREIKPLKLRGNMPAPKYREPTLRQHPRNPRDYNKLRVPSDIFDQIVLSTNLPYMQKLPEDEVELANVEQQKRRPYTDLFEARHHHDHWKATQVKQVDVHYQPHLVQAEITKIKKKSDRVIMENFRMANPPCNQFVDMDLSWPQYNFEEMIKDQQNKSKKTKTKQSGIVKSQDNCQQKDYKLQTRDPHELEDLDYPGRQEYLQLLKDAKELYKESQQMAEAETKLYVNKTDLFTELEEDLKNIESCLTSLSSSVCTNLTNDSGSYLLMEGKEKIPLDYIRKSIVPFEELQRSRFQAVPIDVDKEQNNPFQVLPFAGQKKAQLELTTAKDSFFTFNTRLKNGLRLRLEVPIEDVREKLLGQGTNKHKGMVATDIEENYVEELKNRPAIQQIKFKSGQSFIKDALRLKFESLLIQGQMVRTKIYDRLNEQHWCDMQRVKELFEKLFAKWEKREYDAAMAVVYKVKNYYDETDRLKTQLKNLEREMVILNMDIVFIEGHWVRCIMLQNFHYLLGDQEWRVQNDWIHRLETEQEELENFEVSIAKRSTLNIRKREKDDAWAIKTFYEEDYLRNKHDNLIVFPNAISFLEGLEGLKNKTFVLLLEMHFTFNLHTELQYKLETFVDWCAQDLQDKEQFVSRKCAKLYFMSDRAKWLSQRTLRFLQQPIEECFNDVVFQRDRAIIAEAWRRIVPASLRGTSGHELYTIEMVAMMSEVIIELIAKFETIPMDLARQSENKLRSKRAYLRKLSHQAYHIERRIDMEMKKVVKNLEPPYQKPKRQPTKLPRYYIKKRAKPVKIEEKKISKRAKFFFRAFHEDGLTVDASEFRDSITQMDTTQEQIVPFYFDHFLKLNGYTPNYNFKTQIELRDGAEIDRLQVKSVIPEIQERMEQWGAMKKRIMEENIAQNPKIHVAARLLAGGNRNYSKDYASSSDDEKETKKSKKVANEKPLAKEASSSANEESASAKLNRLLASMQTADSQLNLAKRNDVVSKPGEANKKKKLQQKQQVESKDIFAAAKKVASLLGDEKQQQQQTESELLTRLLGGKPSATTPTADEQKSAAGSNTEADISLSELIVGMKIDRRQTQKEPTSTRSEYVRRSLAAKGKQQQNKRHEYSKDRRPVQRKREAELYTGSVNLFGGEPLGIFTEASSLKESPDMLPTWSYLQEQALKVQVAHPPANYFDKLANWTEQGKIWRFPIDNEQDWLDEKDVDFSEHIFLEQHLEDWCPNRGPVRHFMELVCVGLSKNPYITAKEKKEHILWYRDYFESKKDILRELMSKEPKGEQKQVEA